MTEKRRFVWSDREREVLPIDYYLEDILELIEKNQVVIVEGETGSGKTTRIPQAIMDRFKETKIVVTQPRRPVVRWISKRIAWEIGCQLGDDVGYRLFGENPMMSKDTRCVFRVDQSLANQISRTGKLPKGVIIVDEAHERHAHVSIDALLILIKDLLPDFPETKVIITSATIDTEKFSEYFNSAPVLKVEGRCYPVESFVFPLISGEHHSEGAFRAGEAVVKEFVERKLSILHKTEKGKRSLVSSGTVIVFLPGEEDIRNGIKHFSKHIEELSEYHSVKAVTLESEKKASDKEATDFTVELFPCFSKLSPKDQDRAQSVEVENNTLRMIFSTDIARGSATFPRVVGVIDSLQVKRPMVDKNGVSDFQKISISMAESNQGKGRAGRTQPGFYIAIGQEYHNLQDWPMPAILREPLTSVLLQFISAGINPRVCEYLDAPSSENIAVTIKRLQRINALDFEEKITDLGELLLQFPVDPEKALTLIKAEKLGILAETAIAVSMIEIGNIFFTPKPEQKLLVDEWVVERFLDLFPESRFDNESLKIVDCDYSMSNLPGSISQKGEFYEIDGKKIDDDIHNPQGVRMVSDIIRQSWTNSQSDFAALVRVFRAFKAEDFRLKSIFREQGLKDQKEIKDYRKKMTAKLVAWCKRHGLIYSSLRLAEQKLSQLKEAIYASPLNFSNHVYAETDFDADDLTKALMSGMFDHIGLEFTHGFSSPCGEYKVAHTSICPKDCTLTLFASLRKVHISGRNQYYNLADLAAPVEVEWLGEVLPQFCRSEETGVVFYNEAQDSVVSKKVLFFNNMEIGYRVEEAPEHPEAEDVFLDWLTDQIY